MYILGLVPVKNGELFIERFLQNSSIVDGFIILDDNSTDNTIESIYKLPNIVEVVKVDSVNEYFNDAYNRNHLLKLAEKYNPDYVFWLDIDEVWIDLSDIRNVLLNYKPSQLYLPRINLYDNDDTYITSYPNSHFGLQWKCRIVKFSEYYNFKFSTDVKLHFQLNPIKDYLKFYPLLIKHYGIFTDEMQRFKFEFYQKNDTEKLQSYEHLVSKKHKFGSVKDVEFELKQLNYGWE
jgi:hypothetical protein